MLTITGASDDLIEVDGSITEEFTYRDDGSGDLLAFSDGTVLRIRFGGADDQDGNWRITRLAAGTAAFTLEQATGEDGTDTATLDGDVQWVVHGTGIARVR